MFEVLVAFEIVFKFKSHMYVNTPLYDREYVALLPFSDLLLCTREKETRKPILCDSKKHIKESMAI